MVEESFDEIKIERKVFDKRTLLALFKLMKKDFIRTVENIVKEGKESIVLAAKNKSGEWLSVKVYKVEHCEFKSMWKYLVGDPRFKRVKKGRWSIVVNWCKREFRNLKIAFDDGTSCPEPITFNENILLTRFVGEDGVPAPRLIDVKLENYQEVYDFIVNEMIKLSKINLIHGDLSAFNILIFDKPYLIDFSQTITEKHPLAKEFLKRDVDNVNRYFKKIGAKVNENLFDELCKIMGIQ